MASYPNGQWPESLFEEIGRGYDKYGLYRHLAPPGTAARWREIVRLGREKYGVTLYISAGWNVYRPLAWQKVYRADLGVMAAVPGWSSHGGNFGSSDCMAIDVANWRDLAPGNESLAWARFVALCRIVGFTVDFVTPRELWHIGDFSPWFVPTFADTNIKPTPVKTREQIEEEEIMGAKDEILSALEGVKSAIRREGRWRKVGDTTGRRALVRNGSVIALTPDPAAAQEQMKRISKENPLMLPPEELNGVLPVLDPVAFFTYIDAAEDDAHDYGRWVRNTFELDAGDTQMVRTDLTLPFANRGLVWADGRRVDITLGGVAVKRFLDRAGVKSAELVDGRIVTLSQHHVDRANAQRPVGQTWESIPDA